MILVGNQRGGAKDLALHLLKQENEHVEVHEVRGFASQNLMAALNEAHAISRATRCNQFLFSLSLNPPIWIRKTLRLDDLPQQSCADHLGRGHSHALSMHLQKLSAFY